MATAEYVEALNAGVIHARQERDEWIQDALLLEFARLLGPEREIHPTEDEERPDVATTIPPPSWKSEACPSGARNRR